MSMKRQGCRQQLRVHGLLTAGPIYGGTHAGLQQAAHEEIAGKPTSTADVAAPLSVPPAGGIASGAGLLPSSWGNCGMRRDSAMSMIRLLLAPCSAKAAAAPVSASGEKPPMRLDSPRYW